VKKVLAKKGNYIFFELYSKGPKGKLTTYWSVEVEEYDGSECRGLLFSSKKEVITRYWASVQKTTENPNQPTNMHYNRMNLKKHKSGLLNSKFNKNINII